MVKFEINAVPVRQWRLELVGSTDVEFNAQLMQSCIGEMIKCADRNGCLQEGNVHLTAECGKTLMNHHLAAG